MEVNVETRDGVVYVKPIGDVDMSTSPELQHSLKGAMDDRPLRMVVNLGEVPYMDSSGLATLVEAMKIARQQSTRLVLCALQEKVQSIFEIARLNSFFTIVPDEVEASTI